MSALQTIAAIVIHTPFWVWALYAVLLLFGCERTRDSAVPLFPVLIGREPLSLRDAATIANLGGKSSARRFGTPALAFTTRAKPPSAQIQLGEAAALVLLGTEAKRNLARAARIAPPAQQDSGEHHAARTRWLSGR